MDKCPNCDSVLLEDTQAAEILAEHYQKTFELNHGLWEDRNKNFLMLLVIAGAEILLSYRTPALTNFFADLYNHFIQPQPLKTPDDINNGFPFDVLQTILLIVILYLLIQIYHRTSHIIRTYGYLEATEADIRKNLSAHVGEVTFKREGDYYRNNRPRLLKLTGFVYALLLGALLLLVSIGGRWIKNATPSNKSIIDWFILGIIFVYYGNYFFLTIKPAIKKLRQTIRESAYYKDLKIKSSEAAAKGKYVYFIFRVLILPCLIFSLFTLVLLYLINYGRTWPQFDLWRIASAFIQLLIVSILFVICSFIWLLYIENKKVETEAKEGGPIPPPVE